jgi:hypothetical protein
MTSMTNQAAGDESHWLLEPLQSQEVRIFVAVAEDATLTPAMRAALEQLAAAMQADDAEVSGNLMDEPPCHLTSGHCIGHSCTLSSLSPGLGAGLLSPSSVPMSFGLFSF